MLETMHEVFRPPSGCTACRLGKLAVPTKAGDVRGWETEDGSWERLYRTHVVQGDGPVPCPVMLIGEAPGHYEDREGIGFRPHAPAGRVLKRAMDEVGLLRADCYVTNALHCRPVDNKIDKFLDCLETCRSLWLAPEIEAVSPAVIVLLGRVAAQPYFGKEPALAIRQLPDGGPLLIHAPHPSSINRQGGPEHAVGWPKLLQGLATAKRVGYGA